MGLRKLGAGCPTGPALPPGRWLGLGGTCTSALAPDLQCMLSVRRQSNRGRGYFAGSILAGVPDAGELSVGTRRICNVDDQRDQKFADRPLSQNQAGSPDGLAGRCHAGSGEQGIERATPGPAGAIERIKRASAIGADKTFAGVARGSDFARPAAIGVRGDSAGIGGAGRHGEVSNQSRTHRIGKDFAADGSKAVMSTGGNKENLVFRGAENSLPVGVEP
jgi:hypothetical protein